MPPCMMWSAERVPACRRGLSIERGRDIVTLMLMTMLIPQAITAIDDTPDFKAPAPHHRFGPCHEVPPYRLLLRSLSGDRAGAADSPGGRLYF